MTEAPQQLPDVGSHTLDNAVRDYVSKRLRYEHLGDLTENAKGQMKEAEQFLWDLLESEDTKTIHHGLGRITRSTTTIALVRDPEALYEELENLGLLAAFTKVEVRKAELNALLRERVNDGQDVPAGTEPHVQRRISFSRSDTARSLGDRIKDAIGRLDGNVPLKLKETISGEE